MVDFDLGTRDSGEPHHHFLTSYREPWELSASQILAKEALSVSAPMEMKQRGDS